ncbi:MAG: type II toxin-antitoxin system HicB family antitoxin [Patescibacteria group bacterium]
MEKKFKTLNYTIILEPDEGGGYVVRIPTLNIATQGETEQEAIFMAKDAIEGYIACLIDNGEVVPLELSPVLMETVQVAVPV